MKYIYILLFALSSFFSNKSLHAEETYTKLAFFMPDNAMQENIYIPAAYQNNNYYNPSYTPPKTQASPQQRSQKQQKRTQKNKQKLKKTLPVTRKNLIKEQPSQEITSNQPQEVKETEVIAQQAQPKNNPNKEHTDFTAFNFDENIQIKTETPKKTPKPNKTKKLSQLEKLRQQDVSDILYSIPYPDTTKPKYKQIYNLYAISLRSLYKHHNFPDNYEQELSLEKANSLQKFEVK